MRVAEASAPSVFGRVAQVARNTVQATALAVRDRLVSIAHEVKLWTQQLAHWQQIENEAIQAQARAEAARAAAVQADALRAAAQRCDQERRKQEDVVRAEQDGERAAQRAQEIAERGRQVYQEAEDRRRSAAALDPRLVEAQADLRRALTAEQWAELRRERAAQRSRDARAKRDAAAVAATPPDNRRRAKKRDRIRADLLAGKPIKPNRKARKKQHLDSYLKVAERDARHEAIYRQEISASFQAELRIVADKPYAHTTEVSVDRIETSENHAIIARSPLLDGVRPTAWMLAKALEGYAARIAPGVQAKPIRELVISHPDGMHVEDTWFAYQAARHLAALGIPPDRVPWVLIRHSEHAHQHAHLVYVPIEADGTTYVTPFAVVASAFETGRQDAWAEIPVGRLNAPTSKLKYIRNGYFLAQENSLFSYKITSDGTRTEVWLQGDDAAAFRLNWAGLPINAHGHTGGTATHKASAVNALAKLRHDL